MRKVTVSGGVSKYEASKTAKDSISFVLQMRFKPFPSLALALALKRTNLNFSYKTFQGKKSV
jgi:hypothetical protein